MIAFASSLDQAGPITKTVEDSALMLQAMVVLIKEIQQVRDKAFQIFPT